MIFNRPVVDRVAILVLVILAFGLGVAADRNASDRTGAVSAGYFDAKMHPEVGILVSVDSGHGGDLVTPSLSSFQAFLDPRKLGDENHPLLYKCTSPDYKEEGSSVMEGVVFRLMSAYGTTSTVPDEYLLSIDANVGGQVQSLTLSIDGLKERPVFGGILGKIIPLGPIPVEIQVSVRRDEPTITRGVRVKPLNCSLS
jgi:hypothetical protein